MRKSLVRSWHDFSRRGFLKTSVAALAGLAGWKTLAKATQQTQAQPHGMPMPGNHFHGRLPSVDPESFPKLDPRKFLSDFQTGTVSRLSSGQVVREFELIAVDREIEVAPGVFFPAWTYNGTVPGPTLRCTEGELVRVHFRNEGSMPHTIHFHGIHPAKMDGVFELVDPGNEFVYEFVAKPFGLFLYHCHTVPIKKHIHKGLYGTFIVDPKSPRQSAREFVMVLNGFDTDYDGENEFYTVNGVANYYATHPIEIQSGELIRVYLVNVTEFDQINSFHLHGNVYHLYRTGTNLGQYEITDTVMLCQGERCVLEFTYDEPGMFMFHAHQSEFAELGWMAFFKVLPKPLAERIPL